MTHPVIGATVSCGYLLFSHLSREFFPRAGALASPSFTGGGEASFRRQRMMSENIEWLRERVRQFRERAEQATDENLRARLLQAAMIYEREGGGVGGAGSAASVLTAPS